MTYDIKALRDLEKRLAEATDRDLGLDGDILEVVDSASGVIAPPYTASLDAAVSLVERVLPGWGMTLQTTAKGAFSAGVGKSEDTLQYANGKSLALALCLACVRAIIAQEEAA